MLAALLTNLPEEAPPVVAPLGWVWPNDPDEETRKRQARRPVIQPRLEPGADETQPGKEAIETRAFSAEDLVEDLLGFPSGLASEIPSGDILGDISGDAAHLMAVSRRAGLEREMALAILDDDEAMILIILAAIA